MVEDHTLEEQLINFFLEWQEQITLNFVKVRLHKNLCVLVYYLRTFRFKYLKVEFMSYWFCHSKQSTRLEGV
jgi:hypothetical protein